MSRSEQAFDVRVEAAQLAKDRPYGEKNPRWDTTSTLVGSFTKGLAHVKETGLVANKNDYALFLKAIKSGLPEDIQNIPLGPPGSEEDRFISGIAQGDDKVGRAKVRGWPSMATGNAFDLEGPDAQSLVMPPHPALDSAELIAEMTELYWMSLIRDVPFVEFGANGLVKQAVEDLNRTDWIIQNVQKLSEEEKARLRGPFTPHTVFRGVLKGDDVGPYISQFLLWGTPGLGDAGVPEDGYISYGSQTIDQRTRFVQPGRDYMTTWASWLDAQNGANLGRREQYCYGTRFIATPRDLATYVHYDALYQAYLNACIALAGLGAKVDQGIPYQLDDEIDKQQGFPLFGLPHVLTLVTEVALRALKAMWYQKFGVHHRLRPEAVGGLLERYRHEPRNELYLPVATLYNSLDRELLVRIAEHNKWQNMEQQDFGNPRCADYSPVCGIDPMLLPMAYAEGSPQHPSYGAGHAAVAGACVTVLKAWFDMDWELPLAFQANKDGSCLEKVEGKKLKLEVRTTRFGDSSNICIGRNWAGVHYFSDYFEAIKIGEEVAIGFLEEHMLTIREKDFSLTIKKFDGSTVKLAKK